MCPIYQGVASSNNGPFFATVKHARDLNRLFKDDEERRKKQLTARYTFSLDKPRHENAGQIAMSFEQIGAATILEAFDLRSKILICFCNRPCVTKK